MCSCVCQIISFWGLYGFLYTSIKRLSEGPETTPNPPKCNSACRFQKQSPWRWSSIPEYSAPLRKERRLSVSPCLSFAVTFYGKCFFLVTSVFVFVFFCCLKDFCALKLRLGRSFVDADWEHEAVWRQLRGWLSLKKDQFTQNKS